MRQYFQWITMSLLQQVSCAFIKFKLIQPIFNTLKQTPHPHFSDLSLLIPSLQFHTGNVIASLLIGFFFFYLISSVWSLAQSTKRTEKWFCGMILQMRIQVDWRGHADSLEVHFKNLKRPRWLTMQLKPLGRDFRITSQHWAAVPIQRPPKVIHHEEFHFSP